MKLIDQYILKRFLSTFVFVVIIFLSIITVIDLTEKIDKYQAAELTTMQIVGYYQDFMPWIGSLIAPIIIFIATVYVCSRMAAHTEIIAILSSGTSFRRMLVPFFMGATLIAILSFYLNGWIIPNSNKDRLAFELEYLKKNHSYAQRNIHMQVSPNTILYMQSYQAVNKTGYHFTLEKFDGNRLIEKLAASRIVWDTLQKKWTLYDWERRKIDEVFEDPTLEVRQPSKTAEEGGPAVPAEAIGAGTTKARPRRNTPVATVNLKEDKGDKKETKADAKAKPTRPVPEPDSLVKGAKMDTALVIRPKELENDYRKYDGMTMPELNRYINMLRERGSAGVEAYLVEKYTRYASPFTIFILVFMGVIVSSRKSRGGTGMQIALGFLMSFVFLIFVILFRTFAEAGSLPVQISVWIPNIIFGIIAMAMYRYVPR